jgi:hypothetical protein
MKKNIYISKDSLSLSLFPLSPHSPLFLLQERERKEREKDRKRGREKETFNNPHKKKKKNFFFFGLYLTDTQTSMPYGIYLRAPFAFKNLMIH